MHSDIGAISFIYKRILLSLKSAVTKISANQFVYKSIHAKVMLRMEALGGNALSQSPVHRLNITRKSEVKYSALYQEIGT